MHHQDFANGSVFDGLLLGTYTVTEAGTDPVVHSVGIAFENVIEAEAAFDDLSGGEGNDLIAANEAGDYIVGGAGNDLLMGHGGDDVIEGGADNDGLIGGAGNDILEGGLGEDKLYGEDGNDQLAGGDGDDHLFGDNDLLPETEHGNDILDGGAGNDTLVGHGGSDELMGGAGDDSLFGETGDDVLSGGSGGDQLQGGDGDDVLSGDAGDDVLFGEDGDDFLFGGIGSDQIQGGDGNDVIEGGSGDDFLDGEAGADTFVFRPGAGVDVIGDADGSDSVRFISGISLGAITSQVVYGSNDTFLGVNYGQGDVAIIKDGAEGSVSAYAFSDGRVLNTKQFLAATLEAGVYTSSGSGAPVYGGQHDDTLIGSALAEKLFGADGNDTLAGGGGDDVLEGGAGHDVYLMGHGTGQDLIVGEAGETNTLKLFAGLSVGDLRLERQNNDVFIHINNSRDGVVIENYYDESKEWIIEDSTGTLTALSILLGNEQAAVRAGSVAEAKALYTEQVNNFYGSALLATGFIVQADDYTKTITSKSTYQGTTFYTKNYTVGIEVVAQSSDGETIVRTLNDLGESSLLTSDATSVESLSALNTDGAVFASSIDGSGTYVLIADDGSSLNVGQGTSRSIIAPVLSGNHVTDALTGVVASGVKGTWFFSNNVTPSYTTSTTQVTRKTLDIDARLKIFELNAGDSGNKVDASSGLFNVLDGGAGNDILSVAASSSVINIPGGGVISAQGAPGSLLYGNAGDDTLSGSSREDVLIGGTGNDLLNGHGGNDRYIIFAGDGSDIIFDDGAVSSVREQDVIQLPASVSAGDLVVSWGEELVASRITESNWTGELQSLHAVLNMSWGTSDTLTVVIPHTGLNSGLGIDKIEFSDGSRLAFQALAEQAGELPDFDPHNQNNVLTGMGQIFGGAGDDAVNGISVDSGSSNGRPGPIEGDTSSLYDPDISRLVGGAGFDQLFGGDGKDELLGGNIYHSEVIVIDGEGTYAFSGLWSDGDFYKGGKADDTLWLTAGSDVIEYDLGDGNDRVTDFYHSSVGDVFGGVGSQALADASIENRWDDLGIVELEHQQMLINNHDTLRFGVGISADDIKVERIEFTAGASAPEENALSFSLRDGSGKVVFERWFSPAHNQLNRVEFADGTVWEGAVLEGLINGEELNNPPVVNIALPDQVSDEGVIFSYQIPGNTFTDIDANDSLTLTATLADDSALPSWLSFDAGTQTLSGTPGNDDVGSFDIKVMATDSEGLNIADTFTLSIANTNNAPTVVVALSDQNAIEDVAFSFEIPTDTFADVDVGDSLALSATLSDDSTLPSWLAFDVNTGTFNGTPDSGSSASYSLKVTAADMQGALVSSVFMLEVIVGNIEYGTSGADTLYGDGLNNTIYGLEGKDELYGKQGDDLLYGGTGRDTLQGNRGDDKLYGGAGKDNLYGGAGKDKLYGGAGIDKLYGGAGKDKLYGGRGDDVLDGSVGNDVLAGNKGNDTYLFGLGGGQDKIKNYSSSDISQDFDTLKFGIGISAEKLWFIRESDDLIIRILDSDDQIEVDQWYSYEGAELDELVLDDGNFLVAGQVEQLVSAMAAYDRPANSLADLSAAGQVQIEQLIV
ncbi:MAG: putative Ig domain-containing protein, partial [Gammaproteobacteria bacterium]|nr:putative Ig domain-containing protein [Gammaproteobacteria bacterium]